jgi:hypothetical protein
MRSMGSQFINTISTLSIWYQLTNKASIIAIWSQFTNGISILPIWSQPERRYLNSINMVATGAIWSQWDR